MTLRRLGVPSRDGVEMGGNRRRKTAIAFALDQDYLGPFRVMIYSMARALTMMDAPVYVYSNDPRVFEDEVVNRVADRKILIEGEDLAELEDIAENHIQRAERAKWNRGTCLKWAVFDDAAVDQILFLDVDMLCLRPLEGLLSLYPKAALVCCPQFQRPHLAGADEPLPQAEVRRRLEQMINRKSPHSKRINSGVMLVRKPLLNREARSKIIAFAKTRTDVNEQSHLTYFFRRDVFGKSLKLVMASSAYNFQENYFDLTDELDALKLTRRIRVLHYAGSQKPWKAKPEKAERLTIQLWHRYRKLSEEMAPALPLAIEAPAVTPAREPAHAPG